MSAAENLARKILNGEAERIEFELAGKRHRGWRQNFAESRRKDAGKLVTKWWRKAHEAGLQLFVGAGQFMTGSGRYSDSWGEVSFDPSAGLPVLPNPNDAPPQVLPVYAISDIDAMQVIEFANVGSHNWGMTSLLAELNKQPPDINAQQFIADVVNGRIKLRDRRKPWRRVQTGLRKIMKSAPFVITFADPAGLKARFLGRLDDDQAMEAAEIIFELSPEAYDCAPEEIAQRIANKEQFCLWWD